MIADLLTKPLHGTLFKVFADRLTGNEIQQHDTTPKQDQILRENRKKSALGYSDSLYDTRRVRMFPSIAAWLTQYIKKLVLLLTLRSGVYRRVMQCHIVKVYVLCSISVLRQIIAQRFGAIYSNSHTRPKPLDFFSLDLQGVRSHQGVYQHSTYTLTIRHYMTLLQTPLLRVSKSTRFLIYWIDHAAIDGNIRTRRVSYRLSEYPSALFLRFSRRI